MTLLEIWTGKIIPALGLGTWAIGGAFSGGGGALGWGAVEDAASLRAIALALDRGIRFSTPRRPMARGMRRRCSARR
jgi:aryl-alcohol dehydrogenase-like predicted oxidoreductase